MRLPVGFDTSALTYSIRDGRAVCETITADVSFGGAPFAGSLFAAFVFSVDGGTFAAPLLSKHYPGGEHWPPHSAMPGR